MEAVFDPAQIAEDFETRLQLAPEEREKALLSARDIDPQDAITATGYGAKEQRDLGELSDMLLKRASGSGLAEAVDAIRALQEQIAGLDIASLAAPKGFFASLFSKGKRQYAALRRDYTEISYMLDRLANQIDMARLTLQKEIGLLDTLYEKNLACCRALEGKIVAGEQAIDLAKRKQAENDAMGSKASVGAFSDRIYQLRQSKTIGMQLAVQIRLTQYNQQVVAQKLKQMTEFALPLWQSQLALALNVNLQQEALGAYRSAARQAADATEQARRSLKDTGKGAARAGKAVLAELERLKEADIDLKQLLEETLVHAQKTRIP
ncbi:MAG: toxic anion resistance protein [Christensenellales bacterium]